MKSQFCLLPKTLVVLAQIAAAQIYLSEPGDLKVTAPFDFVADKQIFSRGNYVLHWDKS